MFNSTKIRGSAHLFLVLLLVSNGAYAFNLPQIVGCVSNDVADSLFPERKILREADAKKLAETIAVDPETQKLLSDPAIAQYVYLNFFAEKFGQGELKSALHDIADSKDASQQDLYNLVNKKLAAKIQDPEVQARVRETFAGADENLRPGGFGGKIYNAKARLRQILKFPTTVARLKRLTDEGFSQDVMDRGLFDFYGATQLGLKESQLRPWDSIKGGFSSVKPALVENMSPDVWGQVAYFASETEHPIKGYSVNSGDAMRGLLPSVSAFMGRTLEEYLGFEEKTASNLPENPNGGGEGASGYCVNVWCKEESRHENAIGTVADHVTGIKKTTPPTYEADKMGDFSDPDYAIAHLVGRNSSEWNANSVYMFLMAHSKGAAKEWVNNVRRDETKHMAVFSAAWKYIFGNQKNKRTKGMIDKIRALGEAAPDDNSAGGILTAGEWPTLFEFGITHLFVENKVRDYIDSVPLKTMQKIFDSPVKTVMPRESVPIPEEKQKVIDDMIERERAMRERLERWTPEERKKYLDLEKVEADQAPLLETLVAQYFNGFKGAEVPNSPESKIVLKKIDQINTGLDSKTNGMVKMSLQQTLRDYQIMNNSFVRSRNDLAVHFKNIKEGFIVERKGPSETEVLLTEKLSDSSYLVRVKKPADFKFKAGEAVSLTLDTPNGPQFRTLSLASSPTADYVEFAVRDSDSDFKKAFKSLEPGAKVTLDIPIGVLKYDPEAPAVMIAGGIGITPFRGIIQYAKAKNLPAPMQLIYANKDQIPFGAEFDHLAETNPRLTVSHVLSNPDPSWQGAKGRVDEDYLRKTISSNPKNSMYYIVGPPPMVNGVKAALKNLGVPDNRISIEVFSGYKNEGGYESKGSAKEEDDSDKTICFCHSVSQGQLVDAIHGGANTFEILQDATMAGTGCGGCACNVENVLACTLQKLK